MHAECAGLPKNEDLENKITVFWPLGFVRALRQCVKNV
jgi:hypothetical protein